MAPCLDQSIYTLCSAASELNSLTDRLNDRLREVEAALSRSHVGVRSVLADPISGEDGKEWLLSWTKNAGWSFWLLPADSPEFAEFEDCIQLLDAPRRLRILAFPKIQQLVEQLQTEVNEQLEDFTGIRADLPEPKKTAETDDEIPF